MEHVICDLLKDNVKDFKYYRCSGKAVKAIIELPIKNGKTIMYTISEIPTTILGCTEAVQRICQMYYKDILLEHFTSNYIEDMLPR